MTATRTAPWWRTVPNPPCADGREQHDNDEFGQVGSMVCAAELPGSDDEFPFWVLRICSVDPQETPGVVEVDLPAVRGLNLDELADNGTPVESVRQYAVALMRATAS